MVESFNLWWPNVVLLLQELQIVWFVLLEQLDQICIHQEADYAVCLDLHIEKCVVLSNAWMVWLRNEGSLCKLCKSKLCRPSSIISTAPEEYWASRRLDFVDPGTLVAALVCYGVASKCRSNSQSCLSSAQAQSLLFRALTQGTSACSREILEVGKQDAYPGFWPERPSNHR